MSTSNAIPEGRHDNKRKGNGSRPDGVFRPALLAGAIALVLLSPSAGFAEEPALGDKRTSAMAPARRAGRNTPSGLDPFPFRLLSCRPSGIAFDVDMSAPLLCWILRIPGGSGGLSKVYL